MAAWIAASRLPWQNIAVATSVVACAHAGHARCTTEPLALAEKRAAAKTRAKQAPLPLAAVNPVTDGKGYIQGIKIYGIGIKVAALLQA